MVSVQRGLAGIHPAVKFVSVSVDPEYDSPERLLKYANAHHADLKHGYFLTGKLDVVKDVVIQGFKQSMEPILKDSTFDIAHSGRFIVVDKQGRIRGFYEAKTITQQRALIKAVSFLTQKR